MLLDTFAKVVARSPDRIAIIDRHGRPTSFATLWHRANALADQWERAGVVAGDRVVLAMPLGTDLYAALAGLWLLRATAVLPEPAMGLAGLRHAARATRARAYLSGGVLFGALRYLLPELRRLPLHLRPGAGRPSAQRVSATVPDDAALISFTSGSTGVPKAIVRSHDFLAAQDAALDGVLSHGAGLGNDLVAFPVFVLANLGKGLTSALPPWNLRRHAGLDPGTVRTFVERHGISRILAPPAALEVMLAAAPPQTLATVLTGGGPVFPDLVDRLVAWKPGIEVVSAYGSTEAEPIAHLSSRDRCPQNPGLARGIHAGWPVAAARVRIVDGEIQVAGPHVVQGYLDQAADATTKVREGGLVWHRTGDAGRLDEDGLWLLGRHGASIGGFSPFVTEAVARTWPGVRQAALGAGPGGTPVLAIAGDEGYYGEWRHAACRLGNLEIVALRVIPMDSRHGSKVDRPKLDRDIARRNRAGTA